MYFITTISEKHGDRCVGYVSKLEDAISIVEQNQCDLWEAGYYPYAVIEHVKEGIYQYDQDPLWFTFNEKTECYEAHNWGCLILILIMAVLFTLPAFFISPEDPGVGVIVAILWIPFILFMAHKMGVGKSETKVRTRKLTHHEINQLEQEAYKDAHLI